MHTPSLPSSLFLSLSFLFLSYVHASSSDMNFDSHQARPPKSSCRRQNARLAHQASSKSAKHARRRRMELRRMRSAPQCYSNNEMCLNKIRDDEVIIEAKSKDASSVGGSSAGSTSYGQISVLGRRRSMNNVVAVELGFLKRGEESYDHFGVYNGRGGWSVARACGQMLHKMLAKIVEEESSGEEEIDWEEVMAAGFNMMNAEVNKKAVPAMGSTAVVTLVGKNEVVVASCGGSRVVLSRGGVPVQLLDDYKTDKGDIPERTSVIGLNWNQAGKVPETSTPLLETKVRVMRRSDADEFLIMGSEGMWDVIPNELACEVARKYCHGGCESGGAEAAAALIAKLAVAQGSKGNINIIVVDFKGHH